MPDVSFDAATSAASTVGTTRTWSHTCTGTNRLLLACVTIASGSDLITGVTYAGAAMSRIDTRTDFAGATTYLYGLAAPATGANNIVATASSSIGIAGASASYANAKQTTTMDALLGGFNSATASRLWGPITPVTDRTMVVLVGWNSAEVPVASTGVTNRSVVNREAWFVDHGAVISPAADTYFTQTTTAATNWLSLSAAIAPVPTGGAIAPLASEHFRRRRASS